MNSDLRLLRELGEQLKPPAGQLPDDLRRRVLAGALSTHSVARYPARFWTARRSWRLIALTAAATALALAGSIGNAPSPEATLRVSEAQTPYQVLQLAASRVHLAPRSPARRDQFIFSESVATFDQLYAGRWALVGRERMLVREWRPVSGARDGLTEYRLADRPDGPWHSEPIVSCRAGHRLPHACKPEPGDSGGLPTDGDLMYEFLYRSTYDDISAAYAALIGDDDLAFERAARTLYLGQTSPAVQAAVFAAMNRIPGMTVRANATDVTGRRGVALARRGPLGTTELIFDPTTYRYLGMNLTIERRALASSDGPSSMRLMTRQAVKRVAIVNNVGDLP